MPRWASALGTHFQVCLLLERTARGQPGCTAGTTFAFSLGLGQSFVSAQGSAGLLIKLLKQRAELCCTPEPCHSSVRLS